MSGLWEKNRGETYKLDPPTPEMPSNWVFFFSSFTSPDVSTASPHGPVMEDDCAVYEFKTTIGTKG